MIVGSSVLGVITARGGSRRLPGKNLKGLGGLPVVAWTVAAARAARGLDRVIVSSDDPATIAAARAVEAEVPFIRPAVLATGDASIYDVLFHALDSLAEPYGYVVLLQASSPLRTAADIEACLEICRAGAPSCISVVEPAKPVQWLYELGQDGGLRPLLAAPGDAAAWPRAVLPNGAVYVARTDWLRERRNFVGPETRAYVMPRERSVDIDTALDLALARALVEKTFNEETSR